MILLFMVFSPLLVGIAQAATTTVPGGLTAAPEADPLGIIARVFQLALMSGALLAFGAIVYGGIKYTIQAGNPSGESDAKEWIVQALLGLLLLLGAYLILNVISPNLTRLTLPRLKPIEAAPVGRPAGGLPPEAGVGLPDLTARAQLAASGVDVKPGVRLDGLQQMVVSEIIGLKTACGCDVTVTSATEGTHAEGNCSHRNGYKVDLRPTPSLNQYITASRNFTSVGTRSDGAALYRHGLSGGSLYARESNHWDIAFACPI